MKINLEGVSKDEMRIGDDDRLYIRGQMVRYVDLPMSDEEIEVLILSLIERDGVPIEC